MDTMTKDTIIDYAKKILADHGCDEYTYGGEWGKDVLDDLKEAYPNGMEHPYVDVANAILSISKQKPIVRDPWIMVWDTDDTCDGIGCPSFEYAESEAIDTLVMWMTDARNEWNDVFNPTDEELDDYNYMICTSSVYVQKYDPMTDEYEDYWGPSYEDEEEIGWKELTREDIEQEKKNYEEGK